MGGAIVYRETQERKTPLENIRFLPLFGRVLKPFWKSYQFEEGESRHWTLGPLDLWVRRFVGEWQIASLCSTDLEDEHRWVIAEKAPFPEHHDFERYAFAREEEGGRLRLKATFPDRPIVVRPQYPMVIPPGCRTRFYSGVPLSVSISAGPEDKLTLLKSIPARSLSKTWFGTPQEGEACYGSQTKAVLDPAGLPGFGFRVLCPLVVVNDSQEPLPIERLCIRVRHLAIYQGERHLWSNEATVRKTASHLMSDITFATGAPANERGAPLVAPATHQAPLGSLIARSFNNFKQIVDLG